MGFATGFTGGVTLTLSVAYFTVAAHQRNRQQQCDSLRANTNVLRALTLSNPAAAAQLAEQTGAASARAGSTAAGSISPVPQYYYYYQNPPVPAPPRSNLVEELKDRWNTEIEGAARRVQTTDWVAVREAAEDTVAQLWVRAFGSGTPAGDAASAVKEGVVSAAETAQAGAKSLQARAKETASQAVQKGKNAFGTGSAVLANESDATTTEVKKALQQRFSKSTSEPVATKKSVDALLEERYRHSA